MSQSALQRGDFDRIIMIVVAASCWVQRGNYIFNRQTLHYNMSILLTWLSLVERHFTAICMGTRIYSGNFIDEGIFGRGTSHCRLKHGYFKRAIFGRPILHCNVVTSSTGLSLVYTNTALHRGYFINRAILSSRTLHCNVDTLSTGLFLVDERCTATWLLHQQGYLW